MSLKDCILSAANQGLIPPGKQQDLLDDFQENLNKYRSQGMSETDAARQAGKDTFDFLQVKEAQKKRETVKTIKLQQEFDIQLARYRDQSGKKDYGSVIKQKLMFAENKEGINRIRSTEEEIKLVHGRLDSTFSDILKTFRHNLIGVNRNKASLVLLGREIFNPGSTGNKAAEEMAKAWIKTSETARRMFNEAGGQIPKLEKWHLPQSHNELVIRDAGYKAWRDFILDNDLLDLEQMIDYKTGKKLSPEQLELALNDVWNAISTFGYSKKPNIVSYSSRLSNRRLDHRFIKFKDFDSWLAYNKKFGKGNVFDAMVGHLKNMSRDIGMMRTMTPDPDKFFKWMVSRADAELALDKSLSAKQLDKARKKLKSQTYQAEVALKTLNGDFLEPANYTFAKTMAGARDLTTAMYLGSASFMALGDFNLARISARFAGLPAFKIMRQNLKMFMRGLNQDKSAMIEVAASSGMVAEHWSTIASGMARVSADDVDRPEITRRIADFVLRSTGLSWLTQAGRWGVGSEMMAFFARNIGKSWTELERTNNKFFKILTTNNITESDWNIISRIPIYDATVDDALSPGARFLRPADIFQLEDLPEERLMDVFAKYQNVINYVVDFAVPVAKLRGTIVGGGAKRGTVMGEIMASFLQFKQFPLTLMFTHLARVVGRKSMKDRLTMGVDLLISSTIMGTLAFELKQITKGKKVSEPEEMNREQLSRYILNNMIHGGGMGFLGDFLFSTRYGGAKGGAASFMGAVPMLGFEILDFTVGNATRTFQGEDVNYGGDLNDLIKRNFPGGSAWYGRLAIERLIFDNIAEIIDSKYLEKRKRYNKRIYRDEGTEFWWNPGDLKPTEHPFKR